MLGSILDPVVGTAINLESSKIIIYSLLFSLGGAAGWFLSGTCPSLNHKELPTWSGPASSGLGAEKGLGRG